MVDSDKPEQKRLSFWKRVTPESVLAFHGVIAVGWWWLTPGGFPISHPRFWLNQILPFAILGVAIVGIVGLARRRPKWLQLAMLNVSAMWVGGSIAARVAFPISSPRFCWWTLLAGCVGFLLVSRWKVSDSHRRTAAACATVWGIMAGAFVPWALRGPEPSTHPIGSAGLPSAVGESSKVAATIRLNDSVHVEAGNGSVTILHEPYRLLIGTLMGFGELSPDRCWSVLSPPTFQGLPQTRVTDIRHESSDSEAVQLEYSSHASLAVSAPNSQLIEITAVRILSDATYAHLNSFCTLEVHGHRRLFLRFSPCSEARIEAMPFDYPTGRPARFAYRTVNRFVVVEATSGEKGPFHELASGPLQSREPVTLFLDDEDRHFASITFDDWAIQASTDLSPTAGWGVPQNAIEFDRGDQPSDGVSITLTLAATSVGRGWDTVGHSPGTYRNRMQVRFEEASDSRTGE